MPNHKIESGNRTFAYIRNLAFAEFPAEGQVVYLMNATNSDRIVGRVRPPEGTRSYSIKIFNRFLVAEQNELRVNIDSRGLLNLSVAVEQGGLIQLTAVD